MTARPWKLATRPFLAADLAFGLRLSEQAGWNQTPEDWRRAIELDPAGAAVAQVDGLDAGVVTTCSFDRVAWIALLLVAPEMRNRGAGRLLLDWALDRLDRLAIPSVRLDATPLGQPLYEQRGFVPDFSLIRFAGRVISQGAASDRPLDGRLPQGQYVANLTPLSADDLGEVSAVDREVVGVDRSTLLERLHGLAPEAARLARRAGRAVGYVFARPGRVATHIGPCLTLEPDVGPLLLLDALTRHRGQYVYVDIPAANDVACRIAGDAGLCEQRRLLRMTRGPRRREEPLALWAGSGPEKG